MFDIKNNLKVFKGFSPQTRTADITTQACDLQGFSGAMVIMPVGASGDTLSATVLFTVTLTHSDDDATYTTVTSNGTIMGVDFIKGIPLSAPVTTDTNSGV